MGGGESVLLVPSSSPAYTKTDANKNIKTKSNDFFTITSRKMYYELML